MKNVKKTLITILRFLPLILCLVFMAVYMLSDKEITAEGLMNFAPDNPLLAALFLILLYAFKSLTIFFPIIVLNVLGGFLFEPIPAMLINCLGVLVELSIPYWIGRFSGSGFADKLKNKHPKLFELMNDSSNDFFKSFFLRVISCLPGDAVSMLFGARKVKFGTFLFGSFIGTLPGVITATLLGTSITDPDSPMFWISIGLNVGISVISFLIYFLWKRKRNKKERSM